MNCACIHGSFASAVVAGLALIPLSLFMLTSSRILPTLVARIGLVDDAANRMDVAEVVDAFVYRDAGPRPAANDDPRCETRRACWVVTVTRTTGGRASTVALTDYGHRWVEESMTGLMTAQLAGIPPCP